MCACVMWSNKYIRIEWRPYTCTNTRIGSSQEKNCIYLSGAKYHFPFVQIVCINLGKKFAEK